VITDLLFYAILAQYMVWPCVCMCDSSYKFLPSVLWCCWLGCRKGIWPVKNWVVGCWCGYVSGSRCRFAYGLADATANH